MTDTVVSLFAGQSLPNIQTPANLLTTLLPEAVKNNKALVIMIDERAGQWSVNYYIANMTNGDTILALDIIKDKVMNTVLGKG